MKKKVNVFGKSIPVFVIAIFAMVLVSATLVSYISNTVTGTTDVSSPITVEITGISGVGNFDANSYSIALFGGETYTVDTNTIVHTEVTGHIAESVIYDFDGVGIDVNVDFGDPIGDFDIVGCQDDGNTYYYIGNPSDVLPVGTIPSTTTIDTELNLEPKIYTSDTRVILETDRKCIA